MTHSHHKILFAGCANDCAQHLPAVLDNMRRLVQTTAESAFLFVENDSGDQTLPMIEAFCKEPPRAHILNISGIWRHIEQRTVRLAMARNALMARIRA